MRLLLLILSLLGQSTIGILLYAQDLHPNSNAIQDHLAPNDDVNAHSFEGLKGDYIHLVFHSAQPLTQPINAVVGPGAKRIEGYSSGFSSGFHNLYRLERTGSYTVTLANENSVDVPYGLSLIHPRSRNRTGNLRYGGCLQGKLENIFDLDVWYFAGAAFQFPAITIEGASPSVFGLLLDPEDSILTGIDDSGKSTFFLEKTGDFRVEIYDKSAAVGEYEICLYRGDEEIIVGDEKELKTFVFTSEEREKYYRLRIPGGQRWSLEISAEGIVHVALQSSPDAEREFFRLNSETRSRKLQGGVAFLFLQGAPGVSGTMAFTALGGVWKPETTLLIGCILGLVCAFAVSRKANKDLIFWIGAGGTALFGIVLWFFGPEVLVLLSSVTDSPLLMHPVICLVLGFGTTLSVFAGLMGVLRKLQGGGRSSPS